MEKEQWKNDILNSLEGIQRAQPAPQLYDRIKARTGTMIVRRQYPILAAACLIVLLTANITALRRTQVEVPVPSAYQLESANFNLY